MSRPDEIRVLVLTATIGLLVATSLAPVPAPAQSAGGYGDYLAWEDWSLVAPTQRGGLASSWDRSGGHFDANQYVYPPGLIYGDTLAIAADLTGPGIIYRFWMPHPTANSSFPVRLFFDGETTPRIDTDSRDLLSGAFSYFADPLVTTFAGGQSCYEPIPFAQSLRIETENRENMWHWYQWSYRTFPPGTPVTSWTGTLDPIARAARDDLVTMFQNVGQHPAGSSSTSLWTVTGPDSVPDQASLVVADLVGPGVIRRLTLRLEGATDAELDSLLLRVTYDAEVEPAIDVPISSFFRAGHGRVAYKSLPIGTDSPDGFYCYWPMPFRNAVKVELVNSSKTAIAITDCRIEHEPGPIEPLAGYLHTTYAEVVLSHPHPNHVLASVEGTGHYVGSFLSIEDNHDTFFFLEGDDLIVVDGVDSLAGTGMEDGHNGGVYYNWVDIPLEEPEGPSPPYAHRPLFGIPLVENTATPPHTRVEQYRWRIGDRVPFDESLEATFETYYSISYSVWNSVAFWYRLPVAPTDVPAEPRDRDSTSGLELLSSIPSPVAGSARFRFTIPAGAPVVLEILDVGGRRVATVLDESRPAGSHEVGWDRGRLADGVYFVRLRVGGQSETRKIVLVR